MGWVSPTGHNDPDAKWYNEEEAYDENTASGGAWCVYPGDVDTNYLELTLSSPISCDKVRIWPYSSGGTPSLYLYVYYDSSWHTIHSGVLNNDQWNEIEIGSTQTIEKVRIARPSAGTNYVREFDFNQVSGGQTHYGSATLSGAGALSSLAKLTLAAKATLSGVGALSAAAGLTLPGSATLAGTGSLAAAGSKLLAGSAALAGTGSLAALGGLILAASATLAGVGSLAAAGTIEGAIKYGVAALSGVGSLAAAAVTVLAGAATMVGAGSLAAAGAKILSGAASLSGVGSLSAIGTLLGEVFGSATLAGQGFLSVSAESWHILTSEEYQDLLLGQIEFQEV
jgi:hypothetical protein